MVLLFRHAHSIGGAEVESPSPRVEAARTDSVERKGIMVSAYVLVEAQPGVRKEDVATVHQSAHQVTGVKTVHFVMGPMDAVIYLEVNDLDALVDAVGKIRALKGVARTDTCIVMSI